MSQILGQSTQRKCAGVAEEAGSELSFFAQAARAQNLRQSEARGSEPARAAMYSGRGDGAIEAEFLGDRA